MRHTRQASTATLKRPPLPRFDSFHFGMFRCASCLGDVRGPGRATAELVRPVVGDQAEILIPAGLQSFHPACMGDLPVADRGGAA